MRFVAHQALRHSSRTSFRHPFWEVCGTDAQNIDPKRWPTGTLSRGPAQSKRSGVMAGTHSTEKRVGAMALCLLLSRCGRCRPAIPTRRMAGTGPRIAQRRLCGPSAPTTASMDAKTGWGARRIFTGLSATTIPSDVNCGVTGNGIAYPKDWAYPPPSQIRVPRVSNARATARLRLVTRDSSIRHRAP